LRQWRRAAGLVNRALVFVARQGENLAWVRGNKLRDCPMLPADILLMSYLTGLLM
jgi:8-oxo-dGTP diphosphatase